MREISKIAEYVKGKMAGEATGHDWFHVERVLKTATKIAQKEKDVDLFIVQAAALMHDLGDWKVNTSGKTEQGIITDACKILSISEEDTENILKIILNMSFSKNISAKNKLSIEGKIVQDADRLDALGAIGIARVFAYGGKKGRPLYDPAIKPQSFTSTTAYRNSQSHTVNHFYEKLFKLRKQLNTKTAKAIAVKREKFMKTFLKEFYSEWDGNL
jgi:uncharacterized protein